MAQLVRDGDVVVHEMDLITAARKNDRQASLLQHSSTNGKSVSHTQLTHAKLISSIDRWPNPAQSRDPLRSTFGSWRPGQEES
jgi:hypothetical protein